ncbi:MAG: phosphopantothenate--cysteine ligase [Oscillospiraceae bacterium]|nr:phosphopantothenate--cysteine ligase [Oscillospiraceae bacterium]
MKVMVTAGGTIEKIDSVRSIINIATGRLGSLVADAFCALPDIEEIYYLCNRAAVLPKSSEKINVVYTDSVASLENSIAEILNRVSVDIIVHSMAVSDYRVKAVTSMANIKRELKEELGFRNAEANLSSDSPAITPPLTPSKISSDIDDLALIMEKTPKVIAMFQKRTPSSVLVGFKLLNSVSLETLIDAGFRVLQENRCSFTLANDLKDINEDKHIGYLIDNNKDYKKYETKSEIAAAIVSATIEKLRVER